MYLCRIRVRHKSSKGIDYVKWHVVKVCSTLQQAVKLCGANRPGNYCEVLHLVETGLPEIQYQGNMLAETFDPAHIILHLDGLKGGVFVDIPYKCTFTKLVKTVIPEKLKCIGVHRFDLCGTLCTVNGRRASVDDVWNKKTAQHFVLTKLQAVVQFTWPTHVETNFARMQKKFKQRDNWIVVNNKDIV